MLNDIPLQLPLSMRPQAALGVICGCTLSSLTIHHFPCSLQELIVFAFFALLRFLFFVIFLPFVVIILDFEIHFFFCFSVWCVITYLKVHRSFYQACPSYDEPAQEIFSFCCRGSFKISISLLIFFLAFASQLIFFAYCIDFPGELLAH